MGTTKIFVYNLALAHLKERKLASLSENREPRRVLDDLWDQVAAECVAEGYWHHAMRTVMLPASQQVAPSFGAAYAFQKPDDWVRTHTVSDEETFRFPLIDFSEQGGYWFANSTPLYVRYVSNDPARGMSLGDWPANFTAYAAFKLAEYACGRIAGSEELLQGPEGIVKRGARAKLKAKSTDAMDEGPKRPPMGTWGRSRVAAGRIQTPGGDRFDD